MGKKDSITESEHRSYKSELRRHRNTMVILGTGVTLFGLWTIFRTFIITLMTGLESGGASLAAKDPDEGLFDLIVTLVVFMIIIFNHTYTGLNARAEGMGKRSAPGYFGLLVLITAAEVCVVVIMIAFIPTSLKESYADELIVSIVISITEIITLFELLHAIVSARRLRRLIQEEEAECR